MAASTAPGSSSDARHSLEPTIQAHDLDRGAYGKDTFPHKDVASSRRPLAPRPARDVWPSSSGIRDEVAVPNSRPGGLRNRELSWAQVRDTDSSHVRTSRTLVEQHTRTQTRRGAEIAAHKSRSAHVDSSPAGKNVRVGTDGPDGRASDRGHARLARGDGADYVSTGDGRKAAGPNRGNDTGLFSPGHSPPGMKQPGAHRPKLGMYSAHADLESMYYREKHAFPPETFPPRSSGLAFARPSVEASPPLTSGLLARVHTHVIKESPLRMRQPDKMLSGHDDAHKGTWFLIPDPSTAGSKVRNQVCLWYQCVCDEGLVHPVCDWVRLHVFHVFVDFLSPLSC
jgi:hypothetical protein